MGHVKIEDPEVLAVLAVVLAFIACLVALRPNRELIDRAGGASWTVTMTNFPSNADVTVSPASFTIAPDATQTLEIELNLGAGSIGEWVFGEIRLSSPGILIRAEGGS